YGRVAKIDDSFQVKLDGHNSRCCWWPSEGLNLVKTGYRILGQVKHSGAAGQIETLRDDWFPFADRVSDMAQRHRAKQRGPERSRDELAEDIVQRYSGEHKACSLGNRTNAYAAKPLWTSLIRFVTRTVSPRRIKSRGDVQSRTMIGVRSQATVRWKVLVHQQKSFLNERGQRRETILMD